jgi:hypothetical protein
MLLSLTAVTAIAAAAVIAPQPAGAMSVRTVAGVQAAVAGTSPAAQVAYVCRHRYYTSRRVCWWRPGKP